MKKEFIDGLEYKVFFMGGLSEKMYQIRAIKNKGKPMHTGNIHFIDKFFWQTLVRRV